MFQKDIQKFSLMLATAILLFTNPTYSEEPSYTGDPQADFYAALRNGNKKAAQDALDGGARWIADVVGEKPHMFAAESGNVELYIWAEQFDPPANINETDIANRTALHFATASPNGSADLVRYLRSKGANVNAENDMGHTPLFNTATPATMDVAMALFEKPMKTEDFLKAFRSREKDHSTYENLIQNAREEYEFLPDEDKVNVNALTASHETPLHILFSNGESEFADFLLRQGVPADVRADPMVVDFEADGTPIYTMPETEIEMAERIIKEKKAQLEQEMVGFDKTKYEGLKAMIEKALAEGNTKLFESLEAEMEELKTEMNISLVEGLEADIRKFEKVAAVYKNFVAEKQAEEVLITEEKEERGEQIVKATAGVALSPARKELLDHITDLYIKWRGEVENRVKSVPIYSSVSKNYAALERKLLDQTSEMDLFIKFFTLPGTVPTTEISLPKDIDGDLNDPENTIKLSLPSPYWYSKKIGQLKIRHEEYLRLGEVLNTKGIMNVTADDLNELIPESQYNGLLAGSDNFNTRIKINPKIKASKDIATGKVTYEITDGKDNADEEISLASFPSSDYLELFELLTTFEKGEALLKDLVAQINIGKVTIKQPIFVPDNATGRIPSIYVDDHEYRKNPLLGKNLYIDRFTPLEILLPEFFQALIDINDIKFESVLIGLSKDYNESKEKDDGAKEVIKIILKSKVPVLMQILNQSPSPELKITAANLLGALGSDAQKAIGALERQAAYRDSSPTLRGDARAAIAKIKAEINKGRK